MMIVIDVTLKISLIHHDTGYVSMQNQYFLFNYVILTLQLFELEIPKEIYNNYIPSEELWILQY